MTLTGHQKLRWHWGRAMRRDLKEYTHGVWRSQALRMIYRSLQYPAPLLSGVHSPKDTSKSPDYFSFWIASISSGTTWNKSPTMP